jgi:hypothetical protein
VETRTFGITPHKDKRVRPGVKLLEQSQKDAAKKRMKALEKRDNDKLMTDEAKNEYESLIYEFRAWLQEDENMVYDTPQGLEKLAEKVRDSEEWLDDQGPKTGYKEYQSRSYELLGDFSKLKNRKEEHQHR